MDIQKVQISNHNSKLKAFISSFIIDALVFMAALLTVFITFIIIYILSGQSKLKTLVANITLQWVKAVEALVTSSNTQQNCELNSKIPHDFEFNFGNTHGPCQVQEKLNFSGTFILKHC